MNEKEAVCFAAQYQPVEGKKKKMVKMMRKKKRETNLDRVPDLALVGSSVNNEHKRVIFFDLLHRRLGSQWVSVSQNVNGVCVCHVRR